MTSEHIDLNLVDPGDSQNDIAIADALRDLVNGKQEPSAAAQHLTDIIVGECEYALNTYSDPATRQADKGPDPGDWERFLWSYIGKSAKVVPESHSGQDRLVALVAALEQQPKKNVKACQDDKLVDYQLWNITRENNWAYLEQTLWRFNQDYGYHALRESAQARAEYPRYSAFLARLLAAKVIDTSRLRALAADDFLKQDISQKPEIPEAFEANVSAAAQWIQYAGPAVYELCQKGAMAGVGGTRWTTVWWTRWKGRFAEISKSTLGPQTVEIAGNTVGRMEDVESKGVHGDVAQALQFVIPSNDEE